MVEILQKIDIDTRPGKDKPIYEQIAAHIRSSIEGSDVAAGMRLPSISEMMTQWGIAYPTIKSALDILEKENIIRCEAGRGKGPLILKKNVKQGLLEFAFHRWCNSVQFLNLENGIRQFTEENGFNLKVIDSSFNLTDNYQVLLTESRDMDGLIVYPLFRRDYIDAVKNVVDMGVKVVFVDRFFPDIAVSSSCVDNFSGGYMATNHLIEQNDCPVHFFGYGGYPSATNLRYQGWSKAMHEHFKYLNLDRDFFWEIPMAESWPVSLDSHDWEKPAYDIATKCIKQLKTDKCCVFGVNDDAARMAGEAAEQLGWKIGENFFIVGFGDKPYCERLKVPMSSVAQFDEKVGYEGAKLLESLLRSPFDEYQRINRIVPVELKIRQSSVKLD